MAPALPPSAAAAPSAVAAGPRAERILAVAAVAARVCALPLLVNVLRFAPPGSARFAPLAAVVAGAMAEVALYAVVCARRGVVTPGWGLADTATIAATVLVGGLLVRPVTDPPGLGHGDLYNYLMVAVAAVGLTRWPAWVALGAAAVLSAVTVVDGLAAAPAVPTWNVLPDAIAPVGVTVVVVVIAGLLRSAAGQLDRYRQEAVAGAVALAEERERVRQAQALQGPLLPTLDDAARDGAISDAAVRGQLRDEIGWLREVIAAGLVSAPTALRPALRQLVATKSAAGMRIELALPPDEPELLPARVEALVEAAREALTNVAKYAGTGAATVAARVEDGGVAVEVTDTGRGYDPTRPVRGTGVGWSIRRRVAECGGVAEVSSSPGHGTRVRLWMPG